MLEEVTKSTPSPEKAEIRWDYQIKSFHARNNTAFEEILKEEGSNGWELVWIQCPVTYEYNCIFKKVISQ